MKKYLVAFGLSILLAGCSVPFLKSSEKEAQTPRPMPKPAVKVQNPAKTGSDLKVENFYFDAGENGLTLLNTDDDDFSVKLSEAEIGDANIADGILTFTELLSEGENVRVVNLKAFAEAL